jgi:hypothetical protein
MLLSFGDLGDETADVPLDLVRWEIVTRAGIRLAKIAADDERAQPRVGKALGLRDAQSADHLDRGGAADSLEDGTGRVGENVALDEGGVGAARVGLQVNANRVHTSLQHPKRDFYRLRRRPLVRHHDVGKHEPRQCEIGAPELVAHGANRFRRIDTASARKSTMLPPPA